MAKLFNDLFFHKIFLGVFFKKKYGSIKTHLPSFPRHTVVILLKIGASLLKIGLRVVHNLLTNPPFLE